MPYLETVQELLEAKEGEHVQFKEAKNRFDFGEAAKWERSFRPAGAYPHGLDREIEGQC